MQSVLTEDLPTLRKPLASVGDAAWTPVGRLAVKRAVEAVMLDLGIDAQPERQIDRFEQHERDHRGPRAGGGDADGLLAEQRQPAAAAVVERGAREDAGEQ